MPNCFQRMFQKFDIFGSEVALNYQKDNLFRTSFGGFVSIGFFAFIGVFFWNSVSFIQMFTLRDLYSLLFYKNIDPIIHKQRQFLTNKASQFKQVKIYNVSVQVVKLFDVDPLVVTLDATNFMFAVKIDQDSFVTKPYFNLTLEQRDYVKFPNGTQVKNKIPVPLVQCTPEHYEKLVSYGSNWTEIYKTQNFSNYLCPKQILLRLKLIIKESKIKNRLDYQMTIGGNYNSEHFYHVKFSVSKCSNNTLNNATWRPKCASEAELTEYFNKNTNVRFVLNINNIILNPLQGTNFVSSFLEESIFFSIQRTGAYQTADIYFTENIVETDQSLLPLQNIQKQQFVSFQNGNFRSQYVIGPTPNIYADFYFRKDSFRNVLNRSFQKIGDIISYIGGFVQVFIIIAAVMVNYYNEYVCAVSLANKIYDFEFSQINQTKKKGKSKVENNNKNQKKPVLSFTNRLKNKLNENEKEQTSFQNSPEQPSPFGSPLGNEINNDMMIPKLDLNQEIPKNEPNPNKKLKLKKRITTREDDGLLPLDEIKSIITQRKTYMEKKLTKFNLQKFKSSVVDSPSKNENLKLRDIKIELGLKQKDILKNNIQNIKEEERENDTESICHSKQLSQYRPSIQKNTFKLEQIDQSDNNDNIEPETPGKNNQENQIQQFEDIQQTKDISNQISNNNSIEYQKDEINQFEIFSNNEILKNQDNSINNNSSPINQQQNLDQSPLSVDCTPKPLDESSKTIQNKILEGLGFRSNKQFLEREFEHLLKRDQTIKITFKFFLYKLSCNKLFKSEQVLLLDKANKAMRKDLDIFMIINRLKELEKFKSLILDKDQQILFNFFPKPVISIKNNQEILTRAEIVENVKSRRQSISQPIKEDIKIKGKHQKQLNINLKTAVIVKKAANQFKKPIIDKIGTYDSLVAYNKLYEAYEKLIKQGGESQQINLFKYYMLSYLTLYNSFNLFQPKILCEKQKKFIFFFEFNYCNSSLIFTHNFFFLIQRD